MSQPTFITKDFLESVSGNEVISFCVDAGSDTGDNYMSVLYSISAEVIPPSQGNKGECNKEFYMLKCYPSHPSRQEFLNRGNHFFKELSFYKILARDLGNFRIIHEGPSKNNDITLTIPKILGGCAIDYTTLENLNESGIFSPLDNFILMTDLKRSYGFRMADKIKGLSSGQVRVTFLALANLHALSWSLSQTLDVPMLEKYPFLKKSFNERKGEMWLGVLGENVDSAVAAIDSRYDKENNLSRSLRAFQQHAKPLIQFFATQDEAIEEEVKGILKTSKKYTTQPAPPWRVVCHGDCWTGNVLFQYDSSVKENPIRAALIDFPGAKMGCPTLDLACLIYTSTRQEMRKSHLKELLQLYHDQFIAICKLNKVKLPPFFSMNTLEEKFHVSKLVGFLIAVISLPMNLIGDSKDDVNLEDMNENMTMGDMLQHTCSSGVKNQLYTEWMVELVKEMVDDGVI